MCASAVFVISRVFPSRYLIPGKSFLPLLGFKLTWLLLFHNCHNSALKDVRIGLVFEDLHIIRE